MTYVSDSDGDNSLPPLSPEWINKDQLREVFSILSEASKCRIRAEARGTPMEELYNDIEKLDIVVSVGHELVETQIPNSEQIVHLEQLRESEQTLEQEQIIGSDSNLDSQLPHHQENVLETSLPKHIEIESSPLRHEIPVIDGNPVPLLRASTRSLRKRTFASRHPYIADQADWLGICTVDSINEMFNDDEDVTKVVKALNQLYLRRKKRYPDEDRYKSKNFYAHLGMSKLLALSGDSEVSSRDVIEQMSQNAEEDEYESDGKEDDEDEDEQLIPYEGLISSSLPDYDDADNNTRNFYENDEGKDADISEESGDESSEEEQLIKIGGRYRKLSRILRGVLPESARRLDIFKDTKQVKKLKKKTRVLEPRRGLAIKKYGSNSAQSDELQKELNSFIDENQSGEEYTPNHQQLIQKSITDLTPSFTEVSSSSDSESDFVEEVFSDHVRDDLTPTFLVSRIDPYLSFVDVESDSAHEEDRIDHMFASGPKHQSNGSGSKRVHFKARHARSTTPKSYNAELRDLTNIPQHSRKRRYSRRYLTSLKRRKLVSPHLNRTPNVVDASSRRPQAKQVVSNQAITRYKTNIQHANIDIREKQRGQQQKPHQQKAQQQKIAPEHSVGRYAKNEFRRDPIQSTTVFEVESSTRFVRNRNVRQSGNTPDKYAPSKEFLFGLDGDFLPRDLMPLTEFSKVNTIGDGHIFFNGEDSVVFTLVGKRYSLGLYRLEASNLLSERYFMQLRKLVLDSKMILNPNIREEIHHSLKMIIKWILIAQKHPLEELWKLLNHQLKDFTKLHTREMRQHQSIVSSRLLFIYYIYIRIETTRVSNSEQQLPEHFNVICSDYWSVLFQSFSASEISSEFSPEARETLLRDSLAIMYSIFTTQKSFWWAPIIEALHDSIQVIYDKVSLLNVIYILSSLVPRNKYNWGCFLSVLSELKSEKTSEFYHHFIDTCALAVQRLSWPLEERLITQLYSSFAQRQFGNFSDEGFVPRPLGLIQTRLDIPESSVFERFMGLLYNHVSSLSSKKDVKKLVSKLVASSQYRYMSGRKYQIQFVNRLNLILLLFQVCDVDLSSPFISLVESIGDSRDMFIYGRTFDALVLYCDVAKSRRAGIPLRAFEVLLSSFCTYFNSLFGMPDLLKRAIQFLGSNFQCHNDSSLFQLLKAVSLTKIPDGVLTDFLSMVLISSFEVLGRINELSESEMVDISHFDKAIVNLLSAQMRRLHLVESRQRERIEDSIEIAIQIWMIIASVTNTHHWNVMMLQKYPYIGNEQLREKFVLLMCEEYIKSGPLNDSIITEIDTIMVKGLMSLSISKYALPLYLRLCRTAGSLFFFKKILTLTITTLSQMQTLRQQVLNLVIQNMCSLNSHSRDVKISLLKQFVNILLHEYSRNFLQTIYVEFCKQMVELVQKAGKSLLNNVDEFWEFAVKLGFPNRKKQIAWSESSEMDQLQMLNNELLDALQYNKDLKKALDNWINISHMSAVYSLVQIYISAISIHESHWAHLSNLLQYILSRIEQYQVKVQEFAFQRFLAMLVDIATISSRWKSSTYSIYELDTLTTCSKILHHAYYIYSGYKDQADFMEVARQFLGQIDFHAPHDTQLSSPFTSLSFGMLRNSSRSSYTPLLHNTPEEYSKFYQKLDEQFTMLRNTLQPIAEQGLLDFDFEF